MDQRQIASGSSAALMTGTLIPDSLHVHTPVRRAA